MTYKRIKGTTVTSVSVSKEFYRLMKEHNLSPTEVFRVGLSVLLLERGVTPYDLSPLNAERSIKVKQFLKEITRNTKLSKVFMEIGKLNKIIEEIQ